MAYDTFSWDKVDGAGLPSAYKCERLSPLVEFTDDAGYPHASPENTRDRWVFSASWTILRPAGYVYLVDFFHAHRGGQFFFFMAPWGLAGIPDNIETAVPGGLSPWDSEVIPGAGEPPTYLVRFRAGSLAIEKARYIGCWTTTTPVEFLQI